MFTIPYDAMLIDLMRIAIAYLLALPIGWNREHEAHTAGIRTFPIVAVASCGLAMVGTSIEGATPETYSRILQGLVTGIGFIGGGAILKEHGSVSGTATAASVWSIGIVGAAVGFGMYHIAAALTLINFLTLKLLAPLKVEPPRPAEPKDI
ncbi:MAG: MgtC/SapB family protein [Acidobacteria bacterium]|nr:MgtC/SapB family protein [Acidobacteriota bacterium]